MILKITEKIKKLLNKILERCGVYGIENRDQRAQETEDENI